MSGFKIKIFNASGIDALSVEKSHLLVGSAVHCDVRLTSPSVAPEHLRIWVEGEHLWGQDLGSEFGTTMNEAPLLAMRPLLFRAGDIFILGANGATLSFQSNQTASTARATIRGPARTLKTEDHGDESPFLRQLETDNYRLRVELERLRKKLRPADVSEEEVQEISEVRHNALSEIKAMREAESRRFETWKRESVEEVEKTVLALIQKKSRSQLSRGEFESDISLALKKTLLGDLAAEREFEKRISPSNSSTTKLLFSLLAAGLLCCGHVVYTRMKESRRPASTVYAAPAAPVITSHSGATPAKRVRASR